MEQQPGLETAIERITLLLKGMEPKTSPQYAELQKVLGMLEVMKKQ